MSEPIVIDQETFQQIEDAVEDALEGTPYDSPLPWATGELYGEALSFDFDA